MGRGGGISGQSTELATVRLGGWRGVKSHYVDLKSRYGVT